MKLDRLLAGALFAVLTAAMLVAWSPRYWAVTVLHGGIFALAICWLVANAVRPGPVRWNVLYAPMLMAGLWGLLQLALGTTVYRFQTTRGVMYWLSNAVVMFLAAQVLGDGSIRRAFLTGLAGLACFIAVIGILQYYTSPHRIFWMYPLGAEVWAFGPFVYRNQFAALMELVLPIPLYGVMSRGRHRWANSLLSAALFAAVIASSSRAAALLAVVEVGLVMALSWRRGRLWTFAPVAALGIVLTLVVGFQNVWLRFQEKDPYSTRGKLAASTVEMIRSRPVVGYGLGTWPTVYPEFATFDNGLYVNQAHNDWLQWTAEGGVPFGLALAVVAGGAGILAWRRLWGLGILFVFLHSWIDYPTGEPVIGAILFALIGAMIASGREARAQ